MCWFAHLMIIKVGRRQHQYQDPQAVCCAGLCSGEYSGIFADDHPIGVMKPITVLMPAKVSGEPITVMAQPIL